MLIMITNRSSSFLKGVLGIIELNAISAIYPRIVSSPILITTPLPTPYLQTVPKKARFLDSSGSLMLVQSTVLNYGLLSPVNAELSTLSSLDFIILKSAGILSPIFSSITSPVTSFSAFIYFLTPSLITLHIFGRRVRNEFINSSLFLLYW